MFTGRDLAGHEPRTAILALPESALLGATIDHLHRAGWRVFRAYTCDDVHSLAGQFDPEVVVLPADGSDESSWLTSAKLLETMPELRVLVCGDSTVDGAEFARFVGATPMPGDATAQELADHIDGAIAQPV